MDEDGRAIDNECRLLMPDGAVKHVHIVSYAVRDRNGRLEIIGALQDVTQQRRSEEALGKLRSELAHVARVTSLGALTASIAYEVNLLRTASESMSGIDDRPREIVITTARDGADGVRLSVRDSRVGFDRHSAEKLFDAFYTTNMTAWALGCPSADRSSKAIGTAVGNPNDGRALRSHSRFRADQGRVRMNFASLPNDKRQPRHQRSEPIVFVVDDDGSMRESLALLIHSAGWTAETFGSAAAFLARPRASGPSCLVLDVSLPGLNGFELQERIAGDRSELPIIFITGYGDVPMTVRAMKAGAVEFLTKPFDGDTLLGAVAGAIERSRAALSREAELREIRDRYESLSRREREVMALVVSGLLNKQIGAELHISEITVKAHRGSVMRKMRARSLAHLVTMAMTLTDSRLS